MPPQDIWPAVQGTYGVWPGDQITTTSNNGSVTADLGSEGGAGGREGQSAGQLAWSRVGQCGVEGSLPAWMGRFRLGWILDRHGGQRMLSTEGSSVQLEPVHSDQSGRLGESRKVCQGQILKHREDFTWGPQQGLKRWGWLVRKQETVAGFSRSPTRESSCSPGHHTHSGHLSRERK